MRANRRRRTEDTGQTNCSPQAQLAHTYLLLSISSVAGSLSWMRHRFCLGESGSDARLLAPLQELTMADFYHGIWGRQAEFIGGFCYLLADFGVAPPNPLLPSTSAGSVEGSGRTAVRNPARSG